MEVILGLATIVGGIAAIWFFYEKYIGRANVVSNIEITIHDMRSPNWSGSTAFLRSAIANKSQHTVIVSEVSIEVISADRLLKLKDTMAGAPVVPINGKVSVLPKTGVYPFIFENNVCKFKIMPQDIEEFLLEIDFKEGYIYHYRIVASYCTVKTASAKSTVKSKPASYECKISSAEAALDLLEIQKDENI